MNIQWYKVFFRSFKSCNSFLFCSFSMFICIFYWIRFQNLCQVQSVFQKDDMTDWFRLLKILQNAAGLLWMLKWYDVRHLEYIWKKDSQLTNRTALIVQQNPHVNQTQRLKTNEIKEIINNISIYYYSSQQYFLKSSNRTSVQSKFTSSFSKSGFLTTNNNQMGD